MKTSKHNRVIRSAAMLLATVFILLVLNKSVFTHTHYDGTGNLVSHSHPYNKTNDPDPVKQHKHSLSYLLVLAILGDGTYYLFLLTISLFIISSVILLSRFVTKALKAIALPSLNPRGPPLSFFGI